MIRARNIEAGLTDRLIPIFWDFSSAVANTGKPIFWDSEYSYDVVDVKVLISATYIASQAVTFSLGEVGATTKFVNAQSLGTAQIAVDAQVDVTQTAVKLLAAGKGLIVTGAAAASQTGEGVLLIRLRPLDKSRGAGSKTSRRATYPA